MLVFVDSSAFISSLVSNEGNFKQATTIIKRLEAEGALLITTNMIIAEVLTVLSMKHGKELALTFGEQIRDNSLEIAHVNQDLFESAWQIFKREKSKNLGFVDCVSFAFIKNFRIPSAFAFDKQFLRRGFEVLH